MREIKFRVFIKWLKIILEVESIDFAKKRVYCKTKPRKQNPCDFYSLDEVVLLQYTGLKDKNGIEIFEKDIIKTSRYNNTLDGEIGIVGFIRGSFCLKCPEFQSNQHINLCEFGIIGNHLEIIGNIYENQELLEKIK